MNDTSLLEFAQAVINSIPANIAVVDSTGRIVAVNQAWLDFARLNGLHQNSNVGIGSNYFEICRLAAPDIYTGIEKVMSGETDNFVFEYPCHSPAQERWFQMHAASISAQPDIQFLKHFASDNSTGGAEKSLVISHFDVTDIKSQQSEMEKLAMVSQKTESIVIITDAERRIEWINEGFTRLTGWTLPEIAGKIPGSFLQGAETDPQTVALMKRKLRAHESFEVEILNYHRSGAAYWTYIEAQPIFNENGSLSHYFSIQTDITKRKKLETAVQESEERMRLALESTSQGWWDWNLLTDEFNGSPYLPTLIGLEFGSQSVDRQQWDSLKHPQERIRSARRIAEHFAGKTPELNYHYRARHLDGHWVWLENHARVIERGKDGKPQRMVGTTRDVSAAYQAREQLRRNEHLLRQMSKMALIGGWELDLTTNNLFCSDEIYQIFETPPDFVPTVENFVAFYSPEERLLINRDIQNAVETGELFDFTRQFVSGAGNLRWARLIGEAEVIDGKSVRLFGSAQDVTAQMKNELILREREERFKILADNLPAMVWQSNADGKCNYVNRGWLDFTGKPPEENFGRGWLDCVHPDDSERLENEFHRSLELKQPLTIQYRARRHDGVYRTILDSCTPVFNEDGEFTCTLGTVFDITDRLELEERLRQSQKMEAMGQLAGGVAHDFNNLLTVILNYAETLERKLTHDPQLSRYAERINTAGQRAAELTGQLLAFSRKQVLQPKPHDINNVVIDTLTMVRRIVRQNIQIEANLGEGLGLIYVDRTQFEQVILNLAVNARDAMPDGGTMRFETVAASPAEVSGKIADAENLQFVRLKVSDTGIGMSPETKKRIFEPFYTTKEIGKGTGLGLATTYGVVEQSGGFITVESELNKGSSFTLYFPSVTANAPVEKRAASNPQLSGNETLLVVDDDEGVRVTIVQHLKDCGYRVLVARDGAEALRLYGSRTNEIHLLISDIIMPKLGGIELGEKMRQINPSLKILYISGFTDVEIHSQLQDDEIVFLRKPFSLQELSEIIREIIAAQNFAGSIKI